MNPTRRGLIREDDVAAVRERASIEDLVSRHVTLKRAGTSLKGLCPFHDEKSPSFNVIPASNRYHCFGCGEGGDVIDFAIKVENLTFAEAVEHLADTCGIQLRYSDGTNGPSAAERAASRGARTRLLAVTTDTQAFFAANLNSPEAEPARRFLTERGFTREDAIRFGCGWAPDSWDALLTHLKGRGHTEDDAVTASVATKGERRTVDFFRGRLTFPIRDAAGEVIGFGARRLLESDTGPKYLNSRETPLYKKAQVLYGIETARKAIAKTGRAVIVEGYTDVMACHLAGQEAAIATCGTAFGEEHVKIVRRYLGGHDLTGEVIFCFDGDAAGQKAAIKSFDLDGKFTAHTFVAVEPGGMDPNELRIAKGADGITSLLRSRVPLFEFVTRAKIARHDLTNPEGRIHALRDVAPVIATIRDASLRPEYMRTVASWLALDVDTVRAAVRTVAAPTEREAAPLTDGDIPPEDPDAPPVPLTEQVPPAGHPALRKDHAFLRAVLAHPGAFPSVATMVTEADFTHPAYALTWKVLLDGARASGVITDARFASSLIMAAVSRTPNRAISSIISALAAEPLPLTGEPTDEYVLAAALDLLVASHARHEAGIKAALNSPGLPEAEAVRLDAELDERMARRREDTARLLDVQRKVRANGR